MPSEDPNMSKHGTAGIMYLWWLRNMK